MTHKCVMGGSGCRSKWDNFGMNVFLAVMGAGVLLAAWLLMQQAARNQVVYEFAEAARMGNLQALNEHTDWDSVRSWMKKDLKERAVLYQQTSAPVEAVDALVDDTVRPESLMDLVYYFNSRAGDVDPLAFVSNPRFSGITEFTVEVMLPPGDGAPHSSRLEPVRASFALDGLSWKLKRLDAPADLFNHASFKKKHMASNN